MAKRIIDEAPSGLRTVAQYRAAIKRLNEIANQKASEHGLCSLWDAIVRDAGEETGLELVGRKKSYEVSFDRLSVGGVEEPESDAESEVTSVIVDAVEQRWPDAVVVYDYANVSEDGR